MESVGVDPWEFVDQRELRRALYRYTDMLDGTLVRRYEARMPGGGDAPAASDAVAEYQFNVMRQRSAIDRGMERLEETGPLWWRVVDLYFRQGCSTEPMGWILVASVVGIRTRLPCPGMTVRCLVDRRGEFQDNRHEVKKCRVGKDLQCSEHYRRWGGVLRLSVDALWSALPRADA